LLTVLLALDPQTDEQDNCIILLTPYYNGPDDSLILIRTNPKNNLAEEMVDALNLGCIEIKKVIDAIQPSAWRLIVSHDAQPNTHDHNALLMRPFLADIQKHLLIHKDLAYTGLASCVIFSRVKSELTTDPYNGSRMIPKDPIEKMINQLDTCGYMENNDPEWSTLGLSQKEIDGLWGKEPNKCYGLFCKLRDSCIQSNRCVDSFPESWCVQLKKAADEADTNESNWPSALVFETVVKEAWNQSFSYNNKIPIYHVRCPDIVYEGANIPITNQLNALNRALVFVVPFSVFPVWLKSEFIKLAMRHLKG